jgi:5-methylcytosine-specific restriction protein A
VLTTGGLCPTHRSAREERRGSAHDRGYTSRWERFRLWFLNRLNALAVRGIGVGAICGGRLPGAPVTTHSRCLAEGRVNAIGLQVDHIQPHRGDQRLMFDPLNLQVLCAQCHAVKTATEDGGFGHTPSKSSAPSGKTTGLAVPASMASK